jgi:hypothetical protein
LLILPGISGCLAYLDPVTSTIDAEHTTLFFAVLVGRFPANQLVFSTIRTILDSLLTYHLPAEIALQSIDDTMKAGIEEPYIELINDIHRLLNPQTTQVAINEEVVIDIASLPVDGEAVVTNLLYGVIEWAKGYKDRLGDLFILRDRKNYDQLADYVHQKMFVVMLQVFEIAQNRMVKDKARFLAAAFMSKLDMDRLCVCEGIMLAAFLKRPYPFTDPNGQWEKADIKQRLKLQTMWDDFLLVDATKPGITTYMDNTVVPDRVQPSDQPESHQDDSMVPSRMEPDHPPRSHVEYICYNFFDEMKVFLGLVEVTEMKPNHREQLLTWTDRVWDRLCKPIIPEPKMFKITMSQNMVDKINPITGSDTGSSSRN